MIRQITALAVIAGLIVPATAAPRKVMVLPLDGTAEPDTRKTLSASVQKMARVLDGEVTAGNTSFVDTATAIGCDPEKPACAEQVRSTLDVNEIVYGTADRDGDDITVVVKRYRKGKKTRELAVTQPASDPPSKLESAVLPVFGNEPLPDDPDQKQPDTNPLPVDPDPPKDTQEAWSGSKRERNLWIGVMAGGGLVTLLGVALWFQAASLQDDIDNHRTMTPNDIENLRDLEDKASNRAWSGNIFVLVGLGVVGYGGYRLWKYSKNANEVTVTPAPVQGGAALVVGGRW